MNWDERGGMIKIRNRKFLQIINNYFEKSWTASKDQTEIITR